MITLRIAAIFLIYMMTYSISAVLDGEHFSSNVMVCREFVRQYCWQSVLSIVQWSIAARACSRRISGRNVEDYLYFASKGNFSLRKKEGCYIRLTHFWNLDHEVNPNRIANIEVWLMEECIALSLRYSFIAFSRESDSVRVRTECIANLQVIEERCL